MCLASQPVPFFLSFLGVGVCRGHRTLVWSQFCSLHIWAVLLAPSPMFPIARGLPQVLGIAGQSSFVPRPLPSLHFIFLPCLVSASAFAINDSLWHSPPTLALCNCDYFRPITKLVRTSGSRKSAGRQGRGLERLPWGC